MLTDKTGIRRGAPAASAAGAPQTSMARYPAKRSPLLCSCYIRSVCFDYALRDRNACSHEIFQANVLHQARTVSITRKVDVCGSTSDFFTKSMQKDKTGIRRGAHAFSATDAPLTSMARYPAKGSPLLTSCYSATNVLCDTYFHMFLHDKTCTNI